MPVPWMLRRGRERWKDLPLRAKGFVVVAIPMLALLIVTSALTFVQRQSFHAERDVSNMSEVPRRLDSLASDLIGLESGLRLYMQSRTGDWPRQLEGVEREVTPKLKRLERLVSSEQRTRAQAVQQMAEQRFTLLRTIRQQVDNGVPAAEIDILLHQNQALMDEIRTQLSIMVSEETHLIDLQTAHANMLADRASSVAGLSILFGLGGGFLALMLFTTSVVPPIQTLAENARRVAKRQPLLPVQAGNDEIGSLHEAIQEAGALVNQWGTELHEARAFLEHLIETSPVVMYRRTPHDNSLIFVTANMERILGYAPSEVIGLPNFWLQQVHPDDSGAFVSHLERALETKAPSMEQEYRFLHKDGTYRWLYSVIRIEYEADGLPHSLLGYLHDVTARKQAVEEVLRAKEEAERANRAKSEFLSRMSHELRTPLNAVLGFAQLMELDPLPPDATESVQHILKAGRHLLELINEVLDIARIEAGRMALSTEPVPVKEVLDEVIGLLHPLAVQRGVRLIAPADDLAREVIADRQRLKQVFLNLFSNAIKYNRENGTVSVAAVVVDDERLRIAISDTGVGLSPDKLNRLYTPFDRLGAEQLGVEGTGIGLALSKRLMEVMDGTIGVESEPGVGSTFWLELPVAGDGAQVLAHALSEAAAAQQPITVPTQSRTVLYVEDNLPNYRLIQRVLAYRPHVRLLAAVQGQIGIDLAVEHRPDLILLDLHLPDLPGSSVLERLQSLPETKGIPVVVITADPTGGQLEQLSHAGAHAFLTKPLDVNRFLAVIDETLAEGGSTSCRRPS